jgi:hypothetical protein
MRAFLVAMAMTLIAVAAHSQEMSGGKGRHHSSEQKTDAQKPKADEKAYKAALDRIPDGGKYDPWHNIRQ